MGIDNMKILLKLLESSYGARKIQRLQNLARKKHIKGKFYQDKDKSLEGDMRSDQANIKGNKAYYKLAWASRKRRDAKFWADDQGIQFKNKLKK